jgi:glycerol-3-phosphate O-acyltransferase/dihydroxyacetone phosphate acyltransferase
MLQPQKSQTGSLGFTLTRSLIRLLLAVFYRRIEVVGAERIPVSGALIVAANHHNSVVDAMILLAVVPRRLRTLAAAELFRNPVVGPFLRILGALPVSRPKETGADPGKNNELFAATTATLRDGGAIMIFPEGRTQPEPVLLELRTGAARMLLAAQNDPALPLPVTLLPVGLIFEKPGIFREGRALVVVGEPVSTVDTSPAEAARVITDRLAHAIRNIIVEAPDREILRLITLVESLAPTAPADPLDRVNRLQRTLAGYHWLEKNAPAQLAAFGAKLAAFARAMEEAGLPFGDLPRVYSVESVLKFTCWHLFTLLLGAPLAVCGMLLHAVPYFMIDVVVRLIPHTDEEDATDKIAAGLLFFPLTWAAETWLAWHYGGTVALVALLVLLIPAGFFALSWRERLQYAGQEAAAFMRVLRNHDLPNQWLAMRQDLIAELDALARLVPSSSTTENQNPTGVQ